MNIVAVRAVQPETPDAPPDWRTWLGQILVRIDTDDGLTGYGVGGGGQAGIHVIHTALRALLVGTNSADVETLWQRMYRATLPYGQKGLALMAMSGVDLALWDLCGKRAGKPLAEILGGRVASRFHVTKPCGPPRKLLLARLQASGRSSCKWASRMPRGQ